MSHVYKTNCEVCSKELKGLRRLYCSDRCSALAQNKALRDRFESFVQGDPERLAYATKRLTYGQKKALGLPQ